MKRKKERKKKNEGDPIASHHILIKKRAAAYRNVPSSVGCNTQWSKYIVVSSDKERQNAS